MLAGFSSSGPNFRVRPVSNTLCAQDTNCFFEDEATAGAFVAITTRTPLCGEATVAGMAPKLANGENGGGNDGSSTSSIVAAALAAASTCAVASSAELVALELFADRGGDIGFAGFVFFFGGAFFFDGVASRCEVCSGSSS